MNDPFRSSEDAQILAELPQPLRESVMSILNESLMEAKVARAVDRARAALAANEKTTQSPSSHRPDGHVAKGQRASGAEMDASSGRPVPEHASGPICIVVDSSSFAFTARSTSLLGYFSQIGPFSYLVSALIMGFALIVAWQCQITARLERLETAQEVQTKTKRGVAPAGHVSAMDACHWTDDSTPLDDPDDNRLHLAVDSDIASGRQIRLDSGLLEITYEMGATVILQGPAAFQVDDNGGYLSIGKLTGRLEEKIDDSNPQSLIPNPFVIRTPTAVVTDLGTEFGVEVDKDGFTTSYVFRGEVRLHANAPADAGNDLFLKANEGGRVETNAAPFPAIRRVSVESDRFVRHVPNQRIPIKVFSTGMGIEPGRADPNWQVIVPANADGSQPQTARVVQFNRPDWYGVDVSRTRKWISQNGSWYMFSDPGQTYTFRTTFDLGNGLPDTATLWGRFLADKQVRAIRINGRDVPAPLPKEGQHARERFTSFVIDTGFIAGMNVLEFDVETGEPFSGVSMASLGIRVDLNGTVKEKQPDE